MRNQGRGQNTKPPKKRTKWEQSCTRWRRIGEETEYSEILLTRISRKPPGYRLQQSDLEGKPIFALLVKQPKGIKGWELRTPAKERFAFPTKKKALKFFSQLQHVVIPMEEVADEPASE